MKFREFTREWFAYTLFACFLLLTISGCQNDTSYPQETKTSAPALIPTPETKPTVTSTTIPKPTPTPKHEGIRVSKSDFGDNWPLKVSSGWVSVRSCKYNPSGSGKHGERVFISNDDTVYALNGFALQAGYPHIHEITRQISHGPVTLYDGSGLAALIKVTEQLCS